MSPSSVPEASPSSLAHAKDLSTFRVPDILAPAGGRAQFFAALHAGADAVYLGLKEFNARGRAENFSLEDLSMLVPLAHEHQMQVLVTLNIILKESEMKRILHDLAQLEWIGVDAVIVQDLGLAQLIRDYFPGLRLHASTQLAIHNAKGVEQARKLGFKRVVLARELTIQELRKIKQQFPSEQVEIEVFCHGSLCYSYSGLCFFSGAEDARSGNRGECAYTCRKPYRITSEPGHGFLFSMKDLNTSHDIDKLVACGIDTLKIEGRKKDAQYVATSVGLYRDRLNQVFGRETAKRPRLNAERQREIDLAFSFHRDTTSFFLNGRYHENVIDLNSPTHKGLLIGKVLTVLGRRIGFLTEHPLERFDGIKIEKPEQAYHASPQHGLKVKNPEHLSRDRYANAECQFSLREFTVGGKASFTARRGELISFVLSQEFPLPKVGDLIYKTRSNELKRHTESLAQAPDDTRLRPLTEIQLEIMSLVEGETAKLSFSAKRWGELIYNWSVEIPAVKAHREDGLTNSLQEIFGHIGPLGLQCQLTVKGETALFTPKSQLKKWKHQLIEGLEPALLSFLEAKKQKAAQSLGQDRQPLARPSRPRFQIKIDRLDYLPALAQHLSSSGALDCDELIFEPKRAFLGSVSAEESYQVLRAFAKNHGLRLRLALPTVIRAWDEPLLKPWIKAALEDEKPALELGNLGALGLLPDDRVLDLSADFTLYTLNTEAARTLQRLGFSRVTLSLEDDRLNLEAKSFAWPEGLSNAIILYKDTPLFIAEACSLTALHHGCPGATVCGYRQLEIENEEGEQFIVAHESCKSIVIGKEAFSLSLYQEELRNYGWENLRIDFLTRHYQNEEITKILKDISQERRIPATHPANFERTLL